MWRDQSKLTEAHALLAPVYGWFTEGLDTPVPQEAKALLDDLADTASLPTGGVAAGANVAGGY